MKIKEIICEDVGSESLTSNLVPVLTFLQQRSSDKELTPKLRTNSLIQLVQNAGDSTFNYAQLVAANENDPAVKALIKDFNKDEIILATAEDLAANDDDEEHDNDPEQNPEDVVDAMAKDAANIPG